MSNYIAKITVSSISLLSDLNDIQIGDIVHVADINKYYYYSCDRKFELLENNVKETFILTLYTDIGTFENLELCAVEDINIESDAIKKAMDKEHYSIIVYKNITNNEIVGIRPEIVKAVKAEKRKITIEENNSYYEGS